MIAAITQFGDSTSGIGALGFDGKAFVIQLITFILAYLVLRRWAFGPIIKVLRERRETIENGVKLGEQLRKEQADMEAKVEQALADSRQKADSLIAEAQDEGRQIVKEAEDKAREKAAGVVAEAESRIAQDTARARQALEKELVGLVSDATEAIVEEKIDAKKDAALIDRALKEKQAA
ncbi:MAG TPA: F0F1 ATP synthase subunit B [Candidatus Saccharimonadales bacterium]|nr:F0F1 ATP synthase subunit B [Candidatus Saccharimonadales bacterium]